MCCLDASEARKTKKTSRKFLYGENVCINEVGHFFLSISFERSELNSLLVDCLQNISLSKAYSSKNKIFFRKQKEKHFNRQVIDSIKLQFKLCCDFLVYYLLTFLKFYFIMKK